MMACDRKTLLLISCYADGEANPEEAARAAEHLQTCAECRKLVDDWQGHRQMLQWACTFELPEEFKLEDRQVAVARRTDTGLRWPRVRWDWRLAGGLAAVAVIGFIAHWFAALPPMLGVGKSLAATGQPESARVGSGVTLQISANSKIVRMSDTSIKLEKGSVTAWVRHGTGFRVVTDRLQVLDQGTTFWVGTGPDMDCVTVQEGAVQVLNAGKRREVRAGQVMIARGEEEPSLLSPPVPDGDTEAAGRSLSEWSADHKSNADFEPTGAQSLDWNEGLQRLSKRFPEADAANAYGITSNTTDGSILTQRFGIAGVSGLRKAFRAHFQEIAQVLAGGSVESEWEMHVGYLLVDGIVGPSQLPAGVYYLRLVSTKGRIVWRLSGSDGSDLDSPVVFVDKDALTQGSGMSGGGGTERLQYALSTRNATTPQLTVMLGDWPGKFKPALSLQVRGVLVSDVHRNDQPLISDLNRAVSGLTGFANNSPDVQYLDPGRRHRLLVKWSDEAGNDLCRLSDRAKKGHGGSAILGVVAVDTSFIEPKLPAGAYLLRFVLPTPQKMARFELVAADQSGRGGQVLQLGSVDEPQSGSMRGPQMLPGHSQIELHYGLRRTGADFFEYRFWVLGRPDAKQSERNTMWAQGIVRIKRL